MDANPVFLIEFLLFAGIVLGLAVWQLWSVRRDRNQPRTGQEGDVAGPSEDPPRHPER